MPWDIKNIVMTTLKHLKMKQISMTHKELIGR